MIKIITQKIVLIVFLLHLYYLLLLFFWSAAYSAMSESPCKKIPMEWLKVGI